MSTARNPERGEAAVKQLEEEGFHPEFLHLDVDSEESIRAAKEVVEKKHGRLDILINNAGVLLRVRTTCFRSVSYPPSLSHTNRRPYFGDQ